EIVDLKTEADPASFIENKAKEIQSGMDLSHGPLIKLGLFQCAEGDHLLIAIHHLLVDGVSWRILYEDIQTGQDQFLRGQEIRLPQKTTSFKQWAEQLSTFADSPAMKQENPYWSRVERAQLSSLPKDRDCDETIGKDSETITIHWTAAETEQLLKQTHHAYHTEINDILLTALGMAVQLLRSLTGSLWASIGFHIAYLEVARFVVMPGDRPALLNYTAQDNGLAEIFILYMMIIFVGGIILAVLNAWRWWRIHKS
ncbi:hypothetical protein ACS72_00645, partial [Acinetobacter sp. VT 511]